MPPGFKAFSVAHRGWSSTKNGALLQLAHENGFEAFMTADQSIHYQQNLSRSLVRIVIFAAPSNRLEHIEPLLPQAAAALLEMTPGEVRIIRSAAPRGE